MIRYFLAAPLLISLIILTAGCRSGDVATSSIDSGIQIINEIDWQGHHLNHNLQKTPGTNIILSVDESGDEMRVMATNMDTSEITGFISVAALDSAGIRGSQRYTLSRDGDFYWLYGSSSRTGVSFDENGELGKAINLSGQTSSGTMRYILNDVETLKFSLTQQSRDYMFSRTVVSATNSGEMDEEIAANYFNVNDFPVLETAVEKTMLKRSPVATSDQEYGYAAFRYSSHIFKFSLTNDEPDYQNLMEDPFGTGFPDISTPSVFTNPDGSERRMYVPVVGEQTPYTVAMSAGNGRLYVVANGKPLRQRLRSLAPYDRTIGEPDTHILENSGETLLVYDTETDELLHRIELPFTAFGVTSSDEFLYFSAIVNGESRLIQTTVPF